MAFPLDFVIGATEYTTFDGTVTRATVDNGIDAIPGFSITTTSYFDVDISRHNLSDGWLSVFVILASSAVTLNRTFIILKGATTDLIRLNVGNTGFTYVLQRWNGSAWVDVGSQIASPVLNTTTALRFDIHWNLADSGGEVTLYVNGSSLANFSGDTLTTADTIISSIRFFAANTAGSATRHAQIFVDDVDTRGLLVSRDTPTSNGTYTEWTGSETTVDDTIYVSDTADFAETDAAGERLTLNYESVNATIASYTIEGVVLAANAKAVAEPGLALKPYLRKSSVNYEINDPKRPGSIAFDGITWTLLTDPLTGLPWASSSDVQSFELGFISAT